MEKRITKKVRLHRVKFKEDIKKWIIENSNTQENKELIEIVFQCVWIHRPNDTDKKGRTTKCESFEKLLKQIELQGCGTWTGDLKDEMKKGDIVGISIGFGEDCTYKFFKVKDIQDREKRSNFPKVLKEKQHDNKKVLFLQNQDENKTQTYNFLKLHRHLYPDAKYLLKTYPHTMRRVTKDLPTDFII